MRIQELKIKNYRAFGDAETFVLQKNLTVIAGVNGKGKTAILEGLALVLSRLLRKISPARSGYRSILPMDVHESEAEVDIFIKTLCAGIPLDYNLNYKKETKKIKLTKLTRAVRNTIMSAYGDPDRADDQAPLVVYYTTDRAGYRFPKKIPRVTASGQAMAYNGALFNRTVDYKDFMARFRVAISEAAETESVQNHFFKPNVIKAVNDTISLFLEGFSDLRVEDDPARMVVNKNGETRDLRQLSDGERSFIALICDLGRRLALANPELADPLKGAGVVLIDELELHLHPKWQLEITEKLRTTFPNIQFIVTTHSPFIIQTARQGEVILLDRDLAVDPHGKSLEEVARYVMDVKDTEYSPRIKKMKEVAKEYFKLVKEAKDASPQKRSAVQRKIVKLLAPFSENPAYTAFLQSTGIINENNETNR